MIALEFTGRGWTEDEVREVALNVIEPTVGTGLFAERGIEDHWAVRWLRPVDRVHMSVTVR